MIEPPTSPRGIRLRPGTIPVSHRYTAGVAGERFFRALADRGVFLATRCARCAVTYCPARAFCERCMAALDEEVEVGPEGTLASFTVVRIALDGRRLAEPVTVGAIRLRGADTVLVHRVGGDPGSLAIGATVEAVLLEPERRTGSLDDVEHFRVRRVEGEPEAEHTKRRE